MSELDGSEGREYMQFYSDLQTVAGASRILVLHTIAGGVEYAVPVPKSKLGPAINKGKIISVFLSFFSRNFDAFDQKGQKLLKWSRKFVLSLSYLLT